MTDKEKIDFKNRLKDKALEIFHSRIDSSSTAMREAQLAANEGEKSSAGDKYETSRAMAQNDRDIYARQLETAQKEMSFINQVDVSLFCKKVEIGAMVFSSNGKYFFLTGLGQVELNGEKILFLSINSPIGQNFAGKKSGDKIVFNGKEIILNEVF